MKTSVAILCGLAGSVYAAPVAQSTPTGNSYGGSGGSGSGQTTFQVSDISILQYALTLEHLEAEFYKEGIAKFGSQVDHDTMVNLERVYFDESTHVDFLTKALGDKAVPPCQYNFPMNDMQTFLATAAVLEGVGVSAYLGAAGDIMNKNYLGAAGSILTVEARHAAILRSARGEPGVAAPFDVPQDYRQVYTLASAFITSCPYNTGLMPFPSLTISEEPIYVVNDNISLTMGSGAPSASSGSGWLAAFTSPGNGYVYQPVDYQDGKWHTTIPAGTAGQTYVIIVNQRSVTDQTTVAGPAIIEVKQNIN